jgi:hypothetical protein
MSKKMSRRARKAERARADEASEQSTPLAEEGDLGPGGALLTGGDVDADREGAASVGEEAVGGSVATPDQDVVDEIGRALGVEQEPDAEVRTSQELLGERDRDRWAIEREIVEEAEREEGAEPESRGGR